MEPLSIEGHIGLIAPAACADTGELRLLLRSVQELPDCRALLVAPGAPADGAVADEDAYLLERLRVPTVTWLDGPSTDGALMLALACDVRVAADDAFMRLGTADLVRSAARRLRLLLTDNAFYDHLVAGNPASAREAYNGGLVSALSDNAEGEARRIAGVIAERAPIATSLAKEAIWRGLALPLEQALRTETDLTMLLISTDDRAEGVSAFVEKRPPRFKGT